jgi:hypothetical protein
MEFENRAFGLLEDVLPIQQQFLFSTFKCHTLADLSSSRSEQMVSKSRNGITTPRERRRGVTDAMPWYPISNSVPEPERLPTKPL